MLHVYHPNKAVKGFACSFWYSEKDNAVFATILKQSGWDDKNGNGVFKDSKNDPTKKVNIKLSAFEVGSILDCIERNRPFSSFHDHDETPKSIGFNPWMNGETLKGYSFAVTVTNKKDTTSKNSFYIGLTFGEARTIREFLVYSLHKIFSKKAAYKRLSTPEIDPNNSAVVEQPSDAPPAVKDPLTDF